MSFAATTCLSLVNTSKLMHHCCLCLVLVVHKVAGQGNSILSSQDEEAMNIQFSFIASSTLNWSSKLSIYVIPKNATLQYTIPLVCFVNSVYGLPIVNIYYSLKGAVRIPLI